MRARPSVYALLPKIIGRGVAAADFDNDGRVDFAVNTVGGRLLLLKSTTATGHWLEVALPGFHPGARVTVVLPDGRRLVREVQAGSSYLSSEDPRPHFGLGSATTVSELIVRFPNGSTTRLHDVAADRLVTVRPEPWRMEGCSPVRTERSVARIWDEAILDAIRRDIPAPTTHARNLFHVSAAMWDAWAAYDPKADGYFVTEKLSAPDVQAARETAISYAAYRVLLWRYAQAAGLQATFDKLTATMTSLCLRSDFTTTRRRFARRARQPDRRRSDRGRPKRRLARGTALRRRELRARERAAHRQAPRNDDARRDILAAARTRSGDHPEQRRVAGQGAGVHRCAVGARARLCAPTLEEWRADRPGRSSDRPPRRHRLQAGCSGRDSPQQRARPERWAD